MDNRENDIIPPTPVTTDQDPLITRAQRIDPQAAVSFNGYYGEDFPLGDDGETQRVISRTLVWSNGNDCVPDWAMREAWPEFCEDWERMQTVAWERHPIHQQPTSELSDVDAILALEPSSDALITALYRVLAVECGPD